MAMTEQLIANECKYIMWGPKANKHKYDIYNMYANVAGMHGIEIISEWWLMLQAYQMFRQLL